MNVNMELEMEGEDTENKGDGNKRKTGQVVFEKDNTNVNMELEMEGEDTENKGDGNKRKMGQVVFEKDNTNVNMELEMEGEDTEKKGDGNKRKTGQVVFEKDNTNGNMELEMEGENTENKGDGNKRKMGQATDEVMDDEYVEDHIEEEGKERKMNKISKRREVIVDEDKMVDTDDGNDEVEGGKKEKSKIKTVQGKVQEIKAKVIPIMKNEKDGPSYPFVHRCVLGRSRDCNITVKSTNVEDEKWILNVTKHDQILLTRATKGKREKKLLKDGSTFLVGLREFRVEIVKSRKDERNKCGGIWKIGESVNYDASEDLFKDAAESDISMNDSDSDYEPDELDDSEDDSCGDDEDSCLSEDGNLDDKISDSDSNDSEHSDIHSLKICKKVTVLQTKKNSQGKRNNKSHACVYCEVFSTNIARHMSLKHKDENEVARILMLPKKSKERRKMWNSLVKKGDFNHNHSVLEKGNGLLIPKYRSRSTEPDSNCYLPCQFCMGFYKKSDLWKHQKSCKPPTSSTVSIPPIRGGKLLLPCKQTVNRQLQDDIISKMRDDTIRRLVEDDGLIIRYGERLYEEQGHLVHRHQYICQKLRELGRLLEILQSSEAHVKSLEEAMKACNWDHFINAVKNVAQFDNKTQKFGIPSLALKIGFSMKKCAEDLHFWALKNEDEVKYQISNVFLKMYDCDWKTSISGKALASLATSKYNKTQLLPLVEDVVKMNNYLHQRAEKIRKSWTSECYSEFAKICLAQVIMFNRKRCGEAERITVQSYKDAKKGGQIDPVVLSTLSEFEKNLVKSHMRVEVMGKKGRKVPVLLTKDMQLNISLLLQKRQCNSQYLFARAGNSNTHYRGSDCIRDFAVRSGSKNPCTMTSTKLRKQLATLAQILNLKENSQDILATFQGHDIRIHREFYRLPDDALEVAKVSKILHCVNNGTISHYKGLDFDDIQFDKEVAVEEENENEESEDEEINEVEGLLEDENKNEENEVEVQLVREGKSGKKTKKLAKPKKVPLARHTWTREEKMALERQFKKEITLGKTPGQLECLNAIKAEKYLAGFSWKSVKFAVKNLITARQRMCKN